MNMDSSRDNRPLQLSGTESYLQQRVSLCELLLSRITV